MVLAGGTAGKIGIRYEDRWTAHQAFLVLRERASRIRIEPRNLEGFEFWIRHDDHIEYHQVKRQRTGHGHWSLSSLDTAGVLSAFFRELQDPQAHCVFVSTEAADILEELSQRARDASSYEEYDSDFLKEKRWRLQFEDLCTRWEESDPERCFEALLRIKIETIGEESLRSLIDVESELIFDPACIDGAVAVAIEVLRDHVNQELTAHDLWHALAKHGYRPNPWAGTPTVLAALAEANARFIASRQTTLIQDRLLERPEALEIHELLSTHRVVLVDGSAGTGKSDVLLQLLTQLEAESTPYLAMRLDRLQPTARPDAVGEQLGLPGSPPAVLAAVAQAGRSVLVIDQLDIVGTTSGRSPEFFDCVSEMLRAAESQEEMRLVIACRSFDLNHDARLRQLLHRQNEHAVVTVGRFSIDQVQKTVQALGFDVAALSSEQTELLSVPLHLALLAQLAVSTAERRIGFADVQGLYDAFWTTKREDVKQKLEYEPRWAEVLDRLVDYMSAHQTLSAPREQVDEWERDAEAMASANMLVRDGNRFAFFHEAYFDYVFARRFAGRGRTLKDLLGEDQYLFRRAQVRQVLSHERANGSDQYITDLTYLLTDPSVRFHIKDLVLAWLGQVADPSAPEWKLLSPLLDDSSSPLYGRAWNVLASPQWFRFADEQGHVQTWLDGDPQRTDETVRVLGQLDKELPDRIAELLKPYVGASEIWDRRITWVLGHAELHRSRHLLDLMIQMLDSDDRADNSLGSGNFWYTAHELPTAHPDWGCELLGAYLRNRLRAADRHKVANPFRSGLSIVPVRLHLGEFVVPCADNAPKAFIDHVFPLMVEITHRTARSEEHEDRLVRDEVWYPRHFGGPAENLDDQLLFAGETAMAALARSSPERFEQVVTEFGDTRYETIAALLFKGFAGNPERFADAAINFLLADPARLGVDYAGNDHWATRLLLEKITPHASDANLEHLETLLLSYYTPWERSADGHPGFGYTQFELLGGIAIERRSGRARKRFAELQRKFLLEDAPPPQGITGGAVRSPIAAEQAAKMRDEHWRGAMVRYATDRDFDKRTDFLKGGAFQLSNVLETCAKEEPQRFARLALTLPDDTNVAYFEALLRGVGASEHDIPIQDVHTLVTRCHALPGRPCGRWIGLAVRRFAEDALPQDLLDIVLWYAGADPSPSSDREAENGALESDKLLQHGLNTVRGGSASDIAALIWTRPEHFEEVRDTVQALVADPVNAVRAQAAEILLALLGHYSDEASDLMVRLADGADDSVLATNYVHEFLRYRASHDLDRLRPIIERMIDSTNVDVRRRGAVQAALVSLGDEAAGPLLEKCLGGDDSQRQGVAQVYAQNLRTADLRSQCEARLITLFEDPASEVRQAAGDAIRRLDEGSLGDFEEVIASLIRSRAFVESHDSVLFALKQTTARIPGVTLAACDRVLQEAGNDASDIQTSAAREAFEVSQLLVHAYADSDESELLEQALKLIDRSLELNMYGASQALQEHDR